ncbi:MAG: hypothetical protein M3N23_00970 [Pseudomonadota bacterium]|nr:hypothetical protein [Pseudomonadota bacterium]
MNANTLLWLTVIALGIYHGVNPAMGWPLAVANGMTERRSSALFATLLPLGGGHFMAMAVVLAPFAVLGWYVHWSHAIRLVAGALVLLLGVFKLVDARHPRALARIAPSRIAWWSFLMATAQGAGLMLVPFMLGLCAVARPLTPHAVPSIDAGHAAIMAYLANSTLATALLVGVVHSVTALLAGTLMAWIVYRYLGLRYLRRLWFNLDRVWGGSLVVGGVAGITLALQHS